MAAGQVAPFLRNIVGTVLGRATGRTIVRANVFGLMRGPVVLLDANDRIIDVNPAFERRLAEAVVASSTDPGLDPSLRATGSGASGRPANSLLGRPLADVMPDLADALERPHDDGMVPLSGALDGWAATVETLTGAGTAAVGVPEMLTPVPVARAGRAGGRRRRRRRWRGRRRSSASGTRPAGRGSRG